MAHLLLQHLGVQYSAHVAWMWKVWKLHFLHTHTPPPLPPFAHSLQRTCVTPPFLIQPETLKSLAGAAGFPANEVIITKVSTYLKEADGKTLESWIDFGEIASGVYRRLSQLAVLWSRGIALAGVWLVWVWLRACFAPIVLTGAKA